MLQNDPTFSMNLGCEGYIASLSSLICFPFTKHLVLTAEGHVVQQKKDAGIPVTTILSPPEGTTTFLDGTTWCVALAGVPQVNLQEALDWACGLGMADCKEIQEGGKCFEPETLLSHASYAFNNYYQQSGNSAIACNFGGTAALTKNNPSNLRTLPSLYPA